MAGPLAGVRILDCTTVVLGPWAAQQLGDLGADVIKIEPPDGDVMRKSGPMKKPDMGHFYLALGRNKRSVALDLKSPAGVQAALRVLGVPHGDGMRPAVDCLAASLRE